MSNIIPVSGKKSGSTAGMSRLLMMLVIMMSMVDVSGSLIGQQTRADSPSVAVGARDQITAKEQTEVIRSLCNLLEQNYVFPDVAREIVAHIKTQHESGKYLELTDRKSFAAALTEDLRAKNNDRHLGIRMTPERSSTDETNLGTDFSRTRGRHSNYGFEEVKILPGNVGYIKMSSFALDQLFDVAQHSATTAMEFVGNADSLIFDLRNNSGGSPRLARLLASYLYTDTPVHLNDFYFRSSDSTLEYWTLTDVPGTRMPDVKVYILINKNTFSAAEGFAYNLKHLGRATIVGHASGGGAHGGSTLEVTEKFQAYVPHSRSIHPVTGTDFEGTGVIPDVNVESGKALLTAHIAAINELRKSKLNESNSEHYESVLARLEAEKSPIVLDNEKIQAYVGIYEISPEQRLTISSEDGRLFGLMTGDESPVAVSPITNTRFRVDSHGVEFTFDFDANGKVESLTIHQGGGLVANRIR